MNLKETPKQIFLVIMGKFTITPNLKNICEWLHWKVFCKNIEKSFVRTFFRSELSKGTFDEKNVHLLCERLLKLVKIEKKCFLS